LVAKVHEHSLLLLVSQAALHKVVVVPQHCPVAAEEVVDQQVVAVAPPVQATTAQELQAAQAAQA
jgi:hypothetical protein